MPPKDGVRSWPAAPPGGPAGRGPAGMAFGRGGPAGIPAIPAGNLQEQDTMIHTYAVIIVPYRLY